LSINPNFLIFRKYRFPNCGVMGDCNLGYQPYALSKAASTGFCAGAGCLAAKPALSGGFFGELPEAIRNLTRNPKPATRTS
jgi:hypothetical protein